MVLQCIYMEPSPCSNMLWSAPLQPMAPATTWTSCRRSVSQRRVFDLQNAEDCCPQTICCFAIYPSNSSTSGVTSIHWKPKWNMLLACTCWATSLLCGEEKSRLQWLGKLEWPWEGEIALPNRRHHSAIAINWMLGSNLHQLCSYIIWQSQGLVGQQKIQYHTKLWIRDIEIVYKIKIILFQLS